MIFLPRRSGTETEAGRQSFEDLMIAGRRLVKRVLPLLALIAPLAALGLVVEFSSMSWQGVIKFPDRLAEDMAAAWPASNLALVGLVFAALFAVAGLDIRSRLARRDRADAPAFLGGGVTPPVRRLTLPTVWRALNFGVMGLALLALVAVASLIAGPKILGWQGVIVLSGSMEPELPTGGLAFVKPMAASEIQVNDILTHRPNPNSDTLITHRVVERIDGPDGLAFRTKGDANEAADLELIPASNVVGRVVFGLPYIGSLVDGLKDRSMFYLIVGIPALLLIVNELWSVGADMRGAARRSSGMEEEGMRS